jgi:hypothetical protein
MEDTLMIDITFKVQDNGNLKITADQEARDELSETYQDGGYTKAMAEVIDAANRIGYSDVRPEWIGALTDAPIIGEDVDYETDPPKVEGRVWWFPDYQIRNEIQELIDDGEVTFTLAPDATPEPSTDSPKI